jgi:hypothetical protein
MAQVLNFKIKKEKVIDVDKLAFIKNTFLFNVLPCKESLPDIFNINEKKLITDEIKEGNAHILKEEGKGRAYYYTDFYGEDLVVLYDYFLDEIVLSYHYNFFQSTDDNEDPSGNEGNIRPIRDNRNKRVTQDDIYKIYLNEHLLDAA